MQKMRHGVPIIRLKKQQIIHIKFIRKLNKVTYNLANIESHLASLSKDDWDKLFSLIPKIQSTDNFVNDDRISDNKIDGDTFLIHPINTAPIVYDFETVMYDLDLVIDFDWGSWDGGREIASKGSFEGLGSVTLLKLLTAFIRNNLFCDGALSDRFKDGTVLKILKELKRNIFK